MYRLVFTNNADTILTAAISDVATTIPVADGTVFIAPNPANNEKAYVTLQSRADNNKVEVVELLTVSANSLTVVRGAEGPALDFSVNDVVEQRVTSGVLQNFLDAADVVHSPTPPPNPRENQRWVESTTNREFSFYYDGSSIQWVEIGTQVYGTDPVPPPPITPYDLTQDAAIVAGDVSDFSLAGTTLTITTGGGSTFPADLASLGAGLDWTGPWDIGTTYGVDAGVEYNGRSYIAIQAGVGFQPDTNPAYWDLLADKGADGVDGADGADGASFTWEGAWSPTTPYDPDDMVEFGGSSYICIQTTTNNQPDTSPTFWDLAASKGDKGDKGDPFNWLGVWSAVTSYVENDAVQHDGSSYTCILAHTGQTPPNATYWDLVAAKGDQGLPGTGGDDGVVTGGTVNAAGTEIQLVRSQGLANVVIAATPFTDAGNLTGTVPTGVMSGSYPIDITGNAATATSATTATTAGSAGSATTATTATNANNANNLGGQAPSYYLDLANHTGAVAGDQVSDATQTTQGAVELATSAEIITPAQTGNQGPLVMTPLEVSNAKLASGQRDAVGESGYETEVMVAAGSRLIKQWVSQDITFSGTGDFSTTIALPITFPTEIHGAQVTAYLIDANEDRVVAIEIINLSTSSIEILGNPVSGSGARSLRIYVYAYGR